MMCTACESSPVRSSGALREPTTCTGAGALEPEEMEPGGEERTQVSSSPSQPLAAFARARDKGRPKPVVYLSSRTGARATQSHLTVATNACHVPLSNLKHAQCTPKCVATHVQCWSRERVVGEVRRWDGDEGHLTGSPCSQGIPPQCTATAHVGGGGLDGLPALCKPKQRR